MSNESEDPARKLSFSVPSSLYDQALDRMKELRIKKLSRYIQYLIMQDAERRGAITAGNIVIAPIAEKKTPQPEATWRVAEEPEQKH